METNANQPAQNDWPWPDSLDALIASPEHHSLLFENESVRVLDTRIRPGETTAIHTHQWASVFYVQSWSDFIRRDDKGNIVLDSRQVESLATPPKAFWSNSSPPHSLENVGNADLWVIAVEVKDETTAAAKIDLNKLSVQK